jgi:hypothetical protein
MIGIPVPYCDTRLSPLAFLLARKYGKDRIVSRWFTSTGARMAVPLGAAVRHTDASGQQVTSL